MAYITCLMHSDSAKRIVVIELYSYRLKIEYTRDKHFVTAEVSGHQVQSDTSTYCPVTNYSLLRD